MGVGSCLVCKRWVAEAWPGEGSRRLLDVAGETTIAGHADRSWAVANIESWTEGHAGDMQREISSWVRGRAAVFVLSCEEVRATAVNAILMKKIMQAGPWWATCEGKKISYCWALTRMELGCQWAKFQSLLAGPEDSCCGWLLGLDLDFVGLQKRISIGPKLGLEPNKKN